MSSTFETGHGKNLTAFQKIIVHIQGLGAPYNPSNATITLSALQTAHTLAQQAVDGVFLAKNNQNNATNTREMAFEDLGKFGTRIVNALDASGSAPQTVADARALLRKLQGGGRRKPKTPPAAETPVITDADTPADANSLPATTRTISVSRHSYDSQVEHFSRIIMVLSTEPLYAPNEPELTLAALQTRLSTLTGLNLAVEQSNSAHQSAIALRESLLYDSATSLVALAGNVKKYVRSVYGSNSPEYKNIAAIQVRR